MASSPLPLGLPRGKLAPSEPRHTAPCSSRRDATSCQPFLSSPLSLSLSPLCSILLPRFLRSWLRSLSIAQMEFISSSLTPVPVLLFLSPSCFVLPRAPTPCPRALFLRDDSWSCFRSARSHVRDQSLLRSALSSPRGRTLSTGSRGAIAPPWIYFSSTDSCPRAMRAQVVATPV